MLRSLSVAATVSLILVEVSCTLLEASDPRPPQPREEIEYTHQPSGSYGTASGNFAGNESPTLRRNYFSGSLSLEALEAQPRQPEPSSGGCKNQDSGSSSMVFNPGAHVNFVVGVPEDYKLEVLDAPGGWRIITITAPEGSDTVNLGFGPQVGYTPAGHSSSLPLGSYGHPNPRFPFMRPLLPGSTPDSLVQGLGLLKPSGPPSQHFEGSPDSLSSLPGTGKFPIAAGVSGTYPNGQYPENVDSTSGQLKPGYSAHVLPGMVSHPRPSGSPGSHPRVQYQYGIPSPPGSPVQVFDQPGEQPGMHIAPQPTNTVGTFPKLGSPGQLRSPGSGGPSEIHPNDMQYFTPSSEYKPESQGPEVKYPDGQYPDHTVGVTPGSNRPGVQTSPQGRVTYSPAGKVPGYDSPGYQSPLTVASPGVHQPSDGHPEKTLHDYSSPSQPPNPESSRPSSPTSGTGTISRPGSDDQYPDAISHIETRPTPITPQSGISPRPHEQSPDRRFPDDLQRPLSPGFNEQGFRPGTDVFYQPHGPSEGYPDGQQPVAMTPSGSQILGDKRLLTPGTSKLVRPGEQIHIYSDGKRPDNSHIPTQPSEWMYPDELNNAPRPGKQVINRPSGPNQPVGRYPDGQQPSGISSSEPQFQTMKPVLRKMPTEPGRLLSPDGQPVDYPIYQTPEIEPREKYPDGQYRDYISRSPQQRIPGMTPSQYQEPDGKYPNIHQISPSGRLEFIVPASQKPGFKDPQPNSGATPDRFTDGQQPDGTHRHPAIIPRLGTPDSVVSLQSGQPDGYPSLNTLNELISIKPGLQMPGTDHQPKTPRGPSGLIFEEPVSPAPEIESYSIPDRIHPRKLTLDGNRPQPLIHVSKYPITDSVVTGGLSVTNEFDRVPGGQYPRQSDFPSMHPIGQSPEYTHLPGYQNPDKPTTLTGTYPEGNFPNVLDRPQGSLPGMESSYMMKGPTEKMTFIQYTDGPNIHFGPGYEPFSPETEEFLRPNGASRRVPGTVANPQGNNLVIDRPLLIAIREANVLHPSQNPDGLRPGLLPGTTELTKPNEPSLRYTVGKLPDEVSSDPTPSSIPISQPGYVVPSVERSSRPKIVLGQSANVQYSVSMGPPEIRKYPGQSSVHFPDNLKQLLEPYLMPQNTSGLITPETGRFPGAIGQQEIYPDNQYPDGRYIANYLGQSEPGFWSPSGGSATSPREPFNRFPALRPVFSSYDKPQHETVFSRGLSLNTVDVKRQGQDLQPIFNSVSPQLKASQPKGSIQSGRTSPVQSVNVPYNVETPRDDSPSGLGHPQTSGQNPEIPEYVQHADSGRAPSSVITVQSGTPVVNPNRIPSPVLIIEERHGKENPRDPVSPSMSQISTGGQPQFASYQVPQPEGNFDSQSSPRQMMVSDGSQPYIEPKLVRTRFVPMRSPEGAQIRTMIGGTHSGSGHVSSPGSMTIRSPSQSMEGGVDHPTGSDGLSRTISSISTKIYGSGQKLVETHGNAITKTYISNQRIQAGQNPSGGLQTNAAPLPLSTYHANVPGGQTYSSPSGPYQIHQTVVPRWPGSTSDRQTYIPAAVRSLDSE